MAMDDQQLLRYSRHIMLEEIGVEGQRRLLGAHALILGAGGLGSPAALYLASAGVGRLTIVDDDVVDLTNLQRQIMHTESSIGQPKVDSARRAIGALNHQVQVHCVRARADTALLEQLVADADVALDCGDNYPGRHALNAACVRRGKPLVSGAAIRFDGQVSVYDPRQPGAPCYACVFPPEQAVPDEPCATLGILAPLVGLVGSIQAAEALKLLSGAGTPLTGRLLMINALSMEFTSIRIRQRADCPVCAAAGSEPGTAHNP